MPRSISLHDLLSRADAPSQNDYSHLVETIVSSPAQLYNLIKDDSVNETLALLLTRSSRLDGVFTRLHMWQKLHLNPNATNNIASATIDLLIQLLPQLTDLLELQALLKLILPALPLCLPPQPPSSIRNLARVLVRCDNPLQSLASDEHGGALIKQWTSSSKTAIHHPAVLELWTKKLAEMVGSCATRHGISDQIGQWDSLMALKTALLAIEETQFREEERIPHASERDTAAPAFTGMIPLHKDDKKARLAKTITPENRFPAIRDDLAALLQNFDLEVPSSTRMLRACIESLESEKTIQALCEMSATLPCRACQETLRSGSSKSNNQAQQEPTDDYRQCRT